MAASWDPYLINECKQFSWWNINVTSYQWRLGLFLFLDIHEFWLESVRKLSLTPNRKFNPISQSGFFLMNTTKVQNSWGKSHDLYWENKEVCCCKKSYLESHSAICLNFTERKISEIRRFLRLFGMYFSGNN